MSSFFKEVDELGLDPYEFRVYGHIARRGNCFASLAGGVTKERSRFTNKAFERLGTKKDRLSIMQFNLSNYNVT